jgi:dipeptidyl-peptidase-3
MPDVFFSADDEIRQYEGFKNVSLGNVIPAACKNLVMSFLSAEDKELLTKYRVQAFELHVGLHELLGHGSGKLLCKHKDGQYNFDHAEITNPLDGELVSILIQPSVADIRVDTYTFIIFFLPDRF